MKSQLSLSLCLSLSLSLSLSPNFLSPHFPLARRLSLLPPPPRPFG